MTADIIDGKAFAASIREKVAGHVTRLKADHGITPGLAVVLVGEDPASVVYTRNKEKAAGKGKSAGGKGKAGKAKKRKTGLRRHH